MPFKKLTVLIILSLCALYARAQKPLVSYISTSAAAADYIIAKKEYTPLKTVPNKPVYYFSIYKTGITIKATKTQQFTELTHNLGKDGVTYIIKDKKGDRYDLEFYFSDAMVKNKVARISLIYYGKQYYPISEQQFMCNKLN